MVLVHASGERITLAKYYPTTGWYFYPYTIVLNQWFEKVSENKNRQTGDTRFHLELEDDGT